MLLDYQTALKLQKECVELQHESIIVCEHPDVITVGRGRDSLLDVLTDKIPVVEVERGGRATLHIPGQIVAYPILNLKKRGLDQIKLLRLLEGVIIETLADFGIDAGVREGETGVWVEGKRKIASLGIAVRNEMSMHGLALNVCCDMSAFKNLKPCGYNADVMTSMNEELKLKDNSILIKVREQLTRNLDEAIKSV